MGSGDNRRCAALVLAGPLACLIEPTPGFGGDTSSTTGSTTGAATTTTDDGATAVGDESGGSSTGIEPQPLDLPPRGYQPRPCGFDFDHDGIVAEAGECDICDGSTEDPDGDGYAQPLLYVDCDAGTDADAGVALACRDPAAPCRTIARAIVEVTHAGGNDDEQGVVCFAGTCNEYVEVRSGQPEIATRPPRGIEVRAFDYPAKPSMLVGWDRDDDEEYPPYDEDDVAILQPPVDAESVLRLDLGSYNTPTHDVEYAHFVVAVPVTPGSPAQGTRILQVPIGVNAPHDRIHLHDLSIRSLRRGHGASSEITLIQLGMQAWGDSEADLASSEFHHLALENLEIVDHGGYVFAEHGDMAADESGPWRIANVTTRALACDKADCPTGASTTAWRMAGWMKEIEILASVFDAGTDAWYPDAGSDPLAAAGPTAIVVGECLQDVAIVHNEFVGWSTAVRVEGNGSGTIQGVEDEHPCDARDVDVVRIDGNFVRDSSDRMVGTVVPFVLQTADPDVDAVGDDRTVAGARLVNNVIQVEHGLVGCAWVQLWGASAGPIELAHDTCIAAIQTKVPVDTAALVRVVPPRSGAIDPLAALAVQGQLFAGQAAGDVAIAAESAPAGWLADHNVFAPDAAFRWAAGAPVDLAGWRAASAQDVESNACTPELYAVGDFHLALDDVCAGDAAVPLPALEFDIDGDPRPVQGRWDAGADQRAP
ncbi:MAG TPA: hypothetical protein VFG69_17870 [Nannocystaceae bacterium]|nr:hypothetical protein [Nannocystaceae bacterium]